MLELSAEGFTSITLGRRWDVAWGDCGEFRTWKDNFDLASPSIVVFECDAAGISGNPLAVAAEALTLADSALPETCGMWASDLAALLNRYRRAAGELEAQAP